MYRWPKSMIFIFLGLSILTAALIHFYLKPLISGEETATPPAAQGLQWSWNDQSRARKILNEDELDQCTEDQTYYEKGLAELPPLIRGERARSDADFPKACLMVSLRKSLMNHDEYRFCSSAGVLSSPCLSETYSNVLFNTFVDLSSCWELPQRELLLVFSANGYFNLTGKTQIDLAGSEAKSADQQQIITNIENSMSPACQRLKPWLAKLKIKDQVCPLTATPENPFWSLAQRMWKARSLKEKFVSARGSVELPEEKEKTERILWMLSNEKNGSEAVTEALAFVSDKGGRSIASSSGLKAKYEASITNWNEVKQTWNQYLKEGSCYPEFLESSSQSAD